MNGICIISIKASNASNDSFESFDVMRYETGYIITVGMRNYVICCDHLVRDILDDHNIFYEGYYAINNDIVNMNLKSVLHLYELDVMVLEIISDTSIESVEPMPLIVSHFDDTVIQKNTITNGIINRKEGTVTFNTFECDSLMFLSFMNINSSCVADIPCITFYDKHFDEDALKYESSGGIISNNGNNIAMISMQCQKNEMKYTKALYLPFINIVVSNMLTNDIKILRGIYIETTCNNTNSLSVIRQSPEYTRKSEGDLTNNFKTRNILFSFNVGDVILKVNNNEFTNDHKLFQNDIGICVPLNAYLLIECTKRNAIQFSIIRNNTKKIQTYSICNVKYNQMPKIMHFMQNKFCVSWCGMKFIELTESALVKFSKYMNVDFWLLKTNEISHRNTRYIMITTDINDYQIEFVVITKIKNKVIKKLQDIINIAATSSIDYSKYINIHGIDITGKKVMMRIDTNC